jgi:hypothetical protein
MVSEDDRTGINVFLRLCPMSGIVENTRFRKMDEFPSSGEGVGDNYSAGSVRKS